MKKAHFISITVLLIAFAALVATTGCSKDSKNRSDNEEITHTLVGEVTDISDTSAYLTVMETETILNPGDEIFFEITDELLEKNNFDPKVGDYISITIKDQIGESYPEQVWALDWSPAVPGGAYIGAEA